LDGLVLWCEGINPLYLEFPTVSAHRIDPVIDSLNKKS